MPLRNSSATGDITKGAIEGILNYTETKIRELLKKFRNKELAFVQDTSIIELIKEQLKSGDWSLCKNYLNDKDLKILVQLGLALRKLESKPEALQNLRDKILNKYHTNGLHIAQFVQNNILTEYIGSLAGKVSSVPELVNRVEKLLKEIDKHVIFVQMKDKVDDVFKHILIKLQANSPDAIIVFASKGAKQLARGIRIQLEKRVSSYSIEAKEDEFRLIIFIFKERRDWFGKY